MYGSIPAVTIPPEQPPGNVTQHSPGVGNCVDCLVPGGEMRGIEIPGTQGVWCLACKHAEQFGKMASETLRETRKV